VQRALLSGPNFAGHVTATLTALRPGCGRLVLVDGRPARSRGYRRSVCVPSSRERCRVGPKKLCCFDATAG